MRTIALALMALMAVSALFGILQDEGVAAPPLPMQEAVQPWQGYKPIHVVTGVGAKSRVALASALTDSLRGAGSDGAKAAGLKAEGFTFATARACSMKIVSRQPGVSPTWQWYNAGESFDFPLVLPDSVIIANVDAAYSDTSRLWAWRR